MDEKTARKLLELGEGDYDDRKLTQAFHKKMRDERMHTDKGGSKEAAQEVIAARDFLKAKLAKSQDANSLEAGKSYADEDLKKAGFTFFTGVEKMKQEWVDLIKKSNKAFDEHFAKIIETYKSRWTKDPPDMNVLINPMRKLSDIKGIEGTNYRIYSVRRKGEKYENQDSHYLNHLVVLWTRTPYCDGMGPLGFFEDLKSQSCFFDPRLDAAGKPVGWVEKTSSASFDMEENFINNRQNGASPIVEVQHLLDYLESRRLQSMLPNETLKKYFLVTHEQTYEPKKQEPPFVYPVNYKKYPDKATMPFYIESTPGTTDTIVVHFEERKGLLKRGVLKQEKEFKLDNNNRFVDSEGNELSAFVAKGKLIPAEGKKVNVGDTATSTKSHKF